MIKHNVTGRMYIGSAFDPDVRTATHFCKLRAGKHPVEDMQDDFNKFGNHFTVSIIGEINNADENVKEFEAMDEFQSCVRGIGYNYKDPHAKKEPFREKYITAITKKIRQIHDIEMLDLISQLLDKSLLNHPPHTFYRGD